MAYMECLGHMNSTVSVFVPQHLCPNFNVHLRLMKSKHYRHEKTYQELECNNIYSTNRVSMYFMWIKKTYVADFVEWGYTLSTSLVCSVCPQKSMLVPIRSLNLVSVVPSANCCFLAQPRFPWSLIQCLLKLPHTLLAGPKTAKRRVTLSVTPALTHENITIQYIQMHFHFYI